MDVTVAKSRSSLWHRIKRLFPYIATGTIAWLLLQQIRLADIWYLLVNIDMGWLLIGFGWYLLTNILRSYRFGTLMGIGGIRRPLQILPEMIALSFMNNVLPSRSGELSFPYLMKRRHNVPVSDSLSYLFIARIFDLVAISTLFIVFSFLERSKLVSATRQTVIGVGLLLLPTLLFLTCLPRLGKWGLQSGEWILGYFHLNERKGGLWLLNNGRRAVHAMARVHHAGQYSRVFVWSILGWLTTFAWFFSYLQAVHEPVDYPLVVVGATFATLSKAIPFVTIGGFGMHEAGWALGFRLTGMSLETAIASGFAVNMLTLLTSLIFTGGGYVWMKVRH